MSTQYIRYPSSSGISSIGSPANGLSLVSGVLSLGLASTSTTGALSSTDWNTFNSKQISGNYITALTGDATASGPGSVALTLATVATAGTYPKVTFNAKGLVTSGTTLSSGDIPNNAANTTGTATNSLNTLITTSTTNAAYPLMLAPTTSTGQQSPLMDVNVTYNPSSDVLTLPSTGMVYVGSLQAQTFLATGVSTIAAAGSNQGTATAMTTAEINITSGTGGVILPASSLIGNTIRITNNTGNNVNVYPNSGGSIDGAATNTAFTLPGGQTVGVTQFASSQWYTTTNVIYGSTGIALSHSTGGVFISLNTPVSIANGGTGLSSTSQNYVFAGPTSGSGAPTWRALIAGDIPSLSYSPILSFSSPLVNTSNTITINQATTSTDGYLSHTDWNTFNGKLTSPLTTKGDIHVYSTTDTRLPAGTNGQVLSSQSGQTTGLQWVTPNSGTVTSVTFTGDGTVLSNSASAAVTTSGTVTASLNTQTQKTFLAGPTSGSAANPTFRTIATTDIPTLNQNTTGTASNVTGTVAVANGGTNYTGGAWANYGAGVANIGGVSGAAVNNVQFNVLQIGKIAFIQCIFVYNWSSGTPTSFQIVLPNSITASSTAGNQSPLYGRNISQGYMIQSAISVNSGTVNFFRYDNTPPLTTSGDYIAVSGFLYTN